MKSLDAEKPLVSVIMPTYNHAKFIGKAIKSVLNQTYKNLELIIIDNYSEDETEKIVASYKDDRIVYLKFRNNGIIAASRNQGIKHSHGDYIAFLDSDDYWMKNKLEVVAEYIKEMPGIDVVCHDEWLQFNKVDKKLLTHGPYVTYKDLLFNGNCLSPSATVVERQKLLEVGGFSEDMEFNSAEDYELWLRLAQIDCQIEYIHDPLGVYRVLGQGETENIALHNRHAMNVLDDHFQRWQPKTLYYRYLIRRRRGGTLRGSGHAFMKQGDHHEAQRYLFMALKQNPFNWKTWALTLLNIARISK